MYLISWTGDQLVNYVFNILSKRNINGHNRVSKFKPHRLPEMCSTVHVYLIQVSTVIFFCVGFPACAAYITCSQGVTQVAKGIL
jgi:hypothetical protein